MLFSQFAGFMALGMIVMLIFGIIITVYRNKVIYSIYLTTDLLYFCFLSLVSDANVVLSVLVDQK